MSLSVESLRTFAIERLTVAAEEIFRVFEQKIDRYEDEIKYQRRLMESVWRPEVKLHRIGLLEVHPPQKKKEGVSTHQHQDGSCDLDQGDSEPPPIKEEQEEPCCYWDREQQTVKQESEALMMTPIHEEDDRETSVSPEPDCDQQLLSNSPRVAESKDQENDNGEDSGSTPGEDLKPTVKQNKRKSHPGNANNPADSAVDWNTDTGPTPATCHTGDEQVKVISDLTGHSPVHANDNPDTHSACGKESNKSRFLLVLTKNETGTGLFKCETCGKAFKQSVQLKQHIRVHIDRRPYSCKACSKTFKSLGELKVHTRVHTGERPYSCKTCGKNFKQLSHLNQHVTLHTDERPYLCKACGKDFKQLSHVNQHMRIHTKRDHINLKRWQIFKQSFLLKEHMSIHAGEAP